MLGMYLRDDAVCTPRSSGLVLNVLPLTFEASKTNFDSLTSGCLLPFNEIVGKKLQDLEIAEELIMSLICKFLCLSPWKGYALISGYNIYHWYSLVDILDTHMQSLLEIS